MRFFVCSANTLTFGAAAPSPVAEGFSKMVNIKKKHLESLSDVRGPKS